jgi:hypothetical protein
VGHIFGSNYVVKSPSSARIIRCCWIWSGCVQLCELFELLQAVASCCELYMLGVTTAVIRHSFILGTHSLDNVA